jgi:hypothetical protein
MQVLTAIFLLATVRSASTFAPVSCRRPDAAIGSHEMATRRLYMAIVSPQDDEEGTYAPLEIAVTEEKNDVAVKDARGEKPVSLSPESLRTGAPS